MTPPSPSPSPATFYYCCCCRCCCYCCCCRRNTDIIKQAIIDVDHYYHGPALLFLDGILVIIVVFIVVFVMTDLRRCGTTWARRVRHMANRGQALPKNLLLFMLLLLLLLLLLGCLVLCAICCSCCCVMLVCCLLFAVCVVVVITVVPFFLKEWVGKTMQNCDVFHMQITVSDGVLQGKHKILKKHVFQLAKHHPIEMILGWPQQDTRITQGENKAFCTGEVSILEADI